MGGVLSPFASQATPAGAAGGDLGGTYPNPTVGATHLSAALPVAQGGTGSATQNFVDLTTNQSVGGNKTLTGLTALSGANASGLATITNTATVTGSGKADLAFTENASSSPAIGVQISGDTMSRGIFRADGLIGWGPGNAALDTFLFRNGVGILDTPGAMIIGGLATLNAGTTTAGSAPVITPTFANGTAAQLSDTTRDYMVYLTVGTAGTALVVAIGPTSGVANTIVPSSTATSGEVITIRLPAGWFLKWSATTATLAGQAAVGC